MSTTSPDGFNWNFFENPTLIAHKFTYVCWSPDVQLFSTVGVLDDNFQGTPFVALSSDGLNWTTSKIICFDFQHMSVCWSPYLFMFCAAYFNLDSVDFSTYTPIIQNLMMQII
jgi:hypothetical protein